MTLLVKAQGEEADFRDNTTAEPEGGQWEG